MYRLIVFFFALSAFPLYSQLPIGFGHQPEITIDAVGTIRVTYGSQDTIYYSVSMDKGRTFSRPSFVTHINDLFLGGSRGPQLATSRDYSCVSAMDKKGNIHSFLLQHSTNQWQSTGLINDSEGSAPEMLMSLAAGDENDFYATWLDLRENRKNNICFSTLSGSRWSKNKIIYRSVDEHVCECCQPSIAVKGDKVAIMFRNWLLGARDLYLLTSSDKGQSFSLAQKLGDGTWMINSCPMDGGGIAINENNNIFTAWQRRGAVFYDVPGKPESNIGQGGHVRVDGHVISWQNGADLMAAKEGREPVKFAEGNGQNIAQSGRAYYAVWEKDGKIVFKEIALL